jgi:transketolase
MDSRTLASRIRQHTIEMVAQAKASHLGGCLSLADVLAVLYREILRLNPGQPDWPDRDRFILSKGHAGAALYAALAETGFFPAEELTRFGQNGSALMAHVSHQVPGVEFSTGSLGHGLPFGCGKALAAKRQGRRWRVFVMLSDGELDEGSTWEALLFAPHHHLDNLIAIVDYNKIQSLGAVSEVLELAPLADKLRAFRWAVREVDGHDHQAIRAALTTVPWEAGKPSCLIAHTIKGKGVDFMEDQLLWHYQSPDAEQVKAALRQLDCAP